MVRDSLGYLLFHYLVLLILIFLVVAVLDRYVEVVPLWAGIAIAIVIGLAYPRLVVASGYGPERWEA